MTNNDELALKLKQTAQLVHDNEAEMVASRDGIYARVSDLAAAGIKLEVGE